MKFRLFHNRKKILFALIILVLFFTTAELFSRWWLADYSQRKYGIDIDSYKEAKLVIDSGLGWKWGDKIVFRGPEEINVEKKSGTYRIITTGDSCVWGALVTYENTFSYKLAQDLNEHYGANRVEVLNAGVVGYNTRQVTKLIDTTLKHFSPDLIVFYGTGEEVSNWIRGKSGSFFPSLEPANAWLFHSKFFLVLNHFIRSTHSPKKPDSIVMQNDDLSAMQRKTESIGAKLLLVEYPIVDTQGRLGSDIAARGLQFLVPVVRTYPALVDINRPVRELIFDNVHPTPLGHAIIARCIADKLIELGWINQAKTAVK